MMVTDLECCKNCTHYDEEWSEWYYKTFASCSLGVFFPVRKGTCKRQQSYSRVDDPWLKLNKQQQPEAQ